MPHKKKRPVEWDVEGVADLLEKMAQMTGMRFQRVKKENGAQEMYFTAPVHPATLPLLLGSLPGALFAQALEHMARRPSKVMPPNDTFEGKKRF